MIAHDGARTAMTVRTEDELTIVVVVGEIDLRTSPQLRRCLLLAAQGTNRALLVDLSRTSFLDCTGLAALTAARDLLVVRNQQLCLRGARGTVRKVLELGGLAASLVAHPDSSSSPPEHLRSPDRQSDSTS